MHERRARVSVTFLFVAHGALFGTWVSRIPAVKDELALDDAELGLALFGAALGTLVALPVAGITVARIGSRPGTRWGLPAFAATLPLVALAPGLPALFVALFAFGAAAAMLDVAMNAHSLAVERVYRRPILSTFHAGWSFGGLLGAAAGVVCTTRASVSPSADTIPPARVTATGPQRTVSRSPTSRVTAIATEKHA
jgi:MFS family permease